VPNGAKSCGGVSIAAARRGLPAVLITELAGRGGRCNLLILGFRLFAGVIRKRNDGGGWGGCPLSGSRFRQGLAGLSSGRPYPVSHPPPGVSRRAGGFVGVDGQAMAACTIASIPTRTASGRSSRVAMTAAKVASIAACCADGQLRRFYAARGGNLEIHNPEVVGSSPTLGIETQVPARHAFGHRRFETRRVRFAFRVGTPDVISSGELRAPCPWVG